MGLIKSFLSYNIVVTYLCLVCAQLLLVRINYVPCFWKCCQNLPYPIMVHPKILPRIQTHKTDHSATYKRDIEYMIQYLLPNANTFFQECLILIDNELLNEPLNGTKYKNKSKLIINKDIQKHTVHLNFVGLYNAYFILSQDEVICCP